MDRPIPGFYFDKEKQRYFKIVGSGNAAPASAAYNADNVKKRKIEEQKAQEARKRHDKTKHLIKRASVLHNTLAGRRMVREFGQVDPGLVVESWSSALRDRGGIDFSPDAEPDDTRMVTQMLINGDDTRSGLGVVYASTNGHVLTGSYIPTDDQDRINFNNDPLMRRSRLQGLRREHIYIESMTSLHYHKPSHNIIMTSRYASGLPHHEQNDPGPSFSGIVTFAPELNDGIDTEQQHVGTDQPQRLPADPPSRPLGEEPRWLIGECDVYQHYRLEGRISDVNSVRVAPASHPRSLMLLATNRGLLEFYQESQEQCDCPRFIDLGPQHGVREVLSADFHPTNPNIVFAGRRDGKFFRIDRRMPDHRVEGEHGDWETSRTGQRGPSSVAHLRALDDHQLLAAGPTSSMAVYDVRWLKKATDAAWDHKGKRSHQRSRNTTTPVVRMYEYTNMPHIDIGLDVAMNIGETGGGIVAAGQDDGTVGLFSVRTGQKLKAGDINKIKLSERQGVVKALQFAAMPWERETSLFVGVGSVVKKYSVGAGDEEDGDDNDFNEATQETGSTSQRTDSMSLGNGPRRPKWARRRGRQSRD